MGKKRRHKKTEEELRRKIKKLQDQLTKACDNAAQSPLEGYYDGSPLHMESVYCEDSIQYEISPEENLFPSEQVPPPVSPSPMAPVLPLPASTPTPMSSVQAPGTSENVTINTDELEEDILMLLGDAPKTDTPLGPPIHKDIASRWQDVLIRGLSKEVKESLLKNYLVPSNCDLLKAPILNPEVKVALPDALVKRDMSLVYRQKQLGIALSALASVTDMILANETEKQKLLKPLSDACRILCDCHFNESKTRRKFVISSINAKLKDALIETNRDKFLFGENVSEKLKAAKTIQLSGDALKNAPKSNFQRTNTTATTNNKARLNYVPQHRKTDTKPQDGQRPTSTMHRQPQGHFNMRRPPDRPQPAKITGPRRR